MTSLPPQVVRGGCSQVPKANGDRPAVHPIRNVEANTSSHHTKQNFKPSNAKYNKTKIGDLLCSLEPSEQSTVYYCDFPNCPRKFALEWTLKVHKGGSHGIRSCSVCLTCSAAFARPYTLHRHVRCWPTQVLTNHINCGA